MQFEPHTKVAAVSRCFRSGFLTATSGVDLAPPNPLTSETIVSTCRVQKAGIGGPLVDFDGSFVGMNSSRTKMKKTAYLPRKQILHFLAFHRMVSVKVKEGVDDATRARMNSEMKAIRPSSLDATSIAKLSESRKGALSKQVLSRLSMSVVALASFHGDTKLRECTGICIESSCPDATSFLTSINLIPLTWHASKITKNLTIADPEIYVDFFIVNVAGVNAAHVSLDHEMQFEPYRKVAAICRNFNSGLLTDTSGVDLASPSARTDETMFSTCQIHKVWVGGPLVDFDGNFIGLNCSCTKEKKTRYVRRSAILRFLGVHGMVSVKEVVDDATRAFLKSLAGEPCYNIQGVKCIINHLEDTFDEDILHKPFKGVASEMKRSDGSLLKKTAAELASESSKSLASEMNKSVVSLASFNAVAVSGSKPCDVKHYIKQTRFAKKFACTGVFIKCNACSATILTSASLIEVCLPNKFRVVGILNFYNLHYNIALIDIIGYWDPHAIQISEHPVTSFMDVIVVGCLFAYHKLMAVEGKVLIGKQSELDCTELCVSTCKITKVGFGGPLIDTDGNFVGMNFYDEEETPFLLRDVIHRLLMKLNKEWTCGHDTIVEGDENIWLLPGRTYKNTDTILGGDGNKWPLPEPRTVGFRGVGLPNDLY
ncbi:hypothetical protein VPH35_084913 [Triticum aestivum]